MLHLPHSHLTPLLAMNPFEFLNVSYIALCRFDTVPAPDSQTDGQTDMPTKASTGLLRRHVKTFVCDVRQMKNVKTSVVENTSTFGSYEDNCIGVPLYPKCKFEE